MTSSEASVTTLALMSSVGCNETSKAENIKCLQNADPYEIMNMRNSFDRQVIDNVVFTKQIDKLIKEKSFKRCNIITGYTSAEMGYFIDPSLSAFVYKNLDATTFVQTLAGYLQSRYPFNKLNFDSILEEYFGTTQISTLDQSSIFYGQYVMDILNSLVFFGPAFRMAEIVSRNGKNAYVYEYDYRIPTSIYDPIYGRAVHQEDIPIFFAEPLSNKVIIDFLKYIKKN